MSAIATGVAALPLPGFPLAPETSAPLEPAAAPASGAGEASGESAPAAPDASFLDALLGAVRQLAASLPGAPVAPPPAAAAESAPATAPAPAQPLASGGAALELRRALESAAVRAGPLPVQQSAPGPLDAAPTPARDDAPRAETEASSASAGTESTPRLPAAPAAPLAAARSAWLPARDSVLPGSAAAHPASSERSGAATPPGPDPDPAAAPVGPAAATLQSGAAFANGALPTPGTAPDGAAAPPAPIAASDAARRARPPRTRDDSADLTAGPLAAAAPAREQRSSAREEPVDAGTPGTLAQPPAAGAAAPAAPALRTHDTRGTHERSAAAEPLDTALLQRAPVAAGAEALRGGSDSRSDASDPGAAFAGFGPLAGAAPGGATAPGGEAGSAPARIFPELPARAESQILEHARLLVNQRGGEVRFDLQPPQLGGLDLRVRVSEHAVHLQLLADRLQVAELITRHLPELQQALEARGLSIERASVEYRERDGGVDGQGGRERSELSDGSARRDGEGRSGERADGGRERPGRRAGDWFAARSLGAVDLHA